MSSEPSTPGRLRSSAPLRILAFVALLSLTLVVCGEVLERVMRKLDTNLTKVEEMMAFEDRSFDVLYIGDSTTLEGVNPAVIDAALGTESYNLATGGQSLLESEMVLRHYLASNEKPRVLMLGVYVNISEYASWMNPAIYLQLSGEHRALYAAKIEEQQDEALDRSYPIFNRVKAYRNRRAVEHMIKYAIQGEKRLPRYHQGHLALELSSEPDLGPEHSVADIDRALASFLGLCEDEGIEVLLFEPPNHPGYSELSHGRAEKVAQVEQLAAGRRFRSFNDRGSLDYAKEEWVNLNHLNARGARRFSEEQLAPYLAHELERQSRSEVHAIESSVRRGDRPN